MKKLQVALIVALALLSARVNPNGPMDPPRARNEKIHLVTMWEDGSYRLTDGSTGCVPGWICELE